MQYQQAAAPEAEHSGLQGGLLCDSCRAQPVPPGQGLCRGLGNGAIAAGGRQPAARCASVSVPSIAGCTDMHGSDGQELQLAVLILVHDGSASIAEPCQQDGYVHACVHTPRAVPVLAGGLQVPAPVQACWQAPMCNRLCCSWAQPPRAGRPRGASIVTFCLT
jgi:hypothetical protein